MSRTTRSDSFSEPTTATRCCVDAGPLVAAASDMVERLGERSQFVPRDRGAGQPHAPHLPQPPVSRPSVEAENISRNTALAFRSSVIGQIMATNDADLAAGYGRTVKSSPLLAMVEDWAFPTYTHDAKPTPDFSLPRSLLLRHTASEVLREVEQLQRRVPGLPLRDLDPDDPGAATRRSVSAATSSARRSGPDASGSCFPRPPAPVTVSSRRSRGPPTRSEAAALTSGSTSDTYARNADFWVKIIREGLDRYRTELTDQAVLDAVGDVDGLDVLDARLRRGLHVPPAC